MKSYREWDAAYVFGALSEDERREYEEHLETCESCKGQVAELSGIPAILSTLPQEQAVQLLDPPEPVPMPTLLEAARKSRRWTRIRIAAAVVSAAAVAAVLTSVLVPSDEPPAGVTTQLAQTIPSPVTASVTLVEEPWGTRIDVKCDYGGEPGGRALPYTLFISDASGGSTRVGSWSAGPGTSMTPTATTDVPRNRITRIEIRLATIDKTVLEAKF
ncbi:zf-HC2 domain-containing protein [Kibdelosporangium philippinense]|uniref:Zf-HC2 domain-containing protein n=1 Tax=Kibdelosporangium philippinense TaxID=211113 RepID=A0ABS8ZTT5_9PSEU|nr:zf-HC2 domain-containing protein [Kibdelosporangium philippinense]MCE7009843.1 zf-HC2 domain-containing protein [Kibdelosporangium philippinense]